MSTKSLFQSNVTYVIIVRCGVCGNGFKSVGALGQHKRLVHKIVGPRATRDPNEKRVRKKK